MSIRQHSRGFTLVELVVVIAVIAILSIVAVVGYDIVMKQAHDNKRATDTTAFMHTLETYYQKNGEYPAGCTQTNFSASVGCTYYTNGGNVNSRSSDGSMYNTTSPSQQINASASIDQIRTILPGIDQSFDDPVNHSTDPITNNASGAFKYFYVGGLVNNTATAQSYNISTNDNSGIATFTCNMTFNLAPGQISDYVAGYYGEQDSIWHLFDGKHGVKITYGPSGGDANRPFCWGGAANAVFDNRSK